jgi:hypothetical protein
MVRAAPIAAPFKTSRRVILLFGFFMASTSPDVGQYLVQIGRFISIVYRQYILKAGRGPVFSYNAIRAPVLQGDWG